MKILLLGPNGQVGWELQRALAPLGEILVAGRTTTPPLAGDLEHVEPLSRTVREQQPDIIVNAAAYTAVDAAETDTARAHLINTIAPGALADEAARLGALLVHFSTDYVFDGTGEHPWTEEHQAAPVNAYGKTKLEGENLVRQSGCRHLIFRTSWVYAARAHNFLRTMLRLACEKDKLRIVNDQAGAPTGAELIADITAHAIRQTYSGRNINGTFHLAADGITTWYGYACHAIEAARRRGLPVRVREADITPCCTIEFPTPARRPMNSRLSTLKLQQAFGVTLPSWQQGVDRVVAEICTK